MSDRAKEFMKLVWERSNEDDVTEEKLISAVLSLASNYVKTYTAQNDLVVLDRNDLIVLSDEIKDLGN